MLHRLKNCDDITVEGLVTTANESAERVAIHAVRLELLRRQARAADLPVEILPLPHPCSNAEYEAVMGEFLDRAAHRGIHHVAFADLFLEDIRRYRNRMFEGRALTPVYPLWGEPTAALAREMLAAGLEAYVTCLDPECVPRELAGRRFDADFLAALPDGVDPCGENGEFHTFAAAGPMFAGRVDVTPGVVVEREGFVYADLEPTPPAGPGI